MLHVNGHAGLTPDADFADIVLVMRKIHAGLTQLKNFPRTTVARNTVQAVVFEACGVPKDLLWVEPFNSAPDDLKSRCSAHDEAGTDMNHLAQRFALLSLASDDYLSRPHKPTPSVSQP